MEHLLFQMVAGWKAVTVMMMMMMDHCQTRQQLCTALVVDGTHTTKTTALRQHTPMEGHCLQIAADQMITVQVSTNGHCQRRPQHHFVHDVAETTMLIPTVMHTMAWMSISVSVKLCPPVSVWWNVQSVLLLNGKAIHQRMHDKVVHEIGSLPVWQAGVNQQPSCSDSPTRVVS